MKAEVRRYRWPLVLLAVAVNVVALVALVFALLPAHSPATPTSELFSVLDEHRAVRADVHGEDRPPQVGDPAPATTPTPVPERLLTAPVQQIVIQKIAVAAPVVALNITPAGAMDVPKGPRDVGWYDFTGKPGLGGNAVFSGHVDYINYGPAVFWDLKKLQPGDPIDIRLTDGSVIHYAVTGSHVYESDDIPMGEVLAQTPFDSITLITCSGTFAGGEYSHRLVVRAVETSVTRAS